MKKPILVIKFGSAAITTDGEIDERIVLEIARQCAQLQPKYNIVIVSSGAVAAGKKFIPKYTGTLAQKKAAAAIGNPLLVRTYGTYFKPFKIALAQSLCERHHFANRSQFLQLKSTYETLWKNNVIPIANENDVVSNKELKFSDNDELATLIAVGFGAEQILFSTSVPGVLDENGKVIPELKIIDKAALALAKEEKSAVGLGGMISKLNFARLANQMGIKAVIFSMKTEDGILKAVVGETGTVCQAQVKKLSSRNKWLASGSLITGLVQVDKGALAALSKRKSLLAVGVNKIIQDFEVGEVFQIADEDHVIHAVAKSKIDSVSLRSKAEKKNIEIAHADDIVLL
ncbi:glutamate 5-kinase [Sphingobacterium mizutaii NBRC 14946 = DSM 11724]|uniref:Glutamate 5-kinase n=2 Tax=Sphingobacterium mizutaii TaxID=1010 RepID=A0AAJ4X8M6_9SPHI|nr:glutamate 5-kinase [Sphingobacterium mizutaii]GEM70070.1 glutamate 5-kinase [Sphingobacterium mizutaii NBRC 14946 = DSM 11724]SDL91247.1 glutamate 5-kinase [Sphingobacterium mizutaii]SNV41025.1 Glutamate 5-kinase [Sphingobacterium mizutaii]